MKEKSNKERYIVVFDDDIIGQFSQLEQAETFQYITAIHSDKGNKIHLYQIMKTIEVCE